MNHPLLVHCLDGASVTGLLIMCLRKFQLWEHRVYQAEFARCTREGVITQDEIDFVEKYGSGDNSQVTISAKLHDSIHERTSNVIDGGFAVEILRDLANISHEITLCNKIPSWLWTGKVPLHFLKYVQAISTDKVTQLSNPSSAVSTPMTPFPSSTSLISITYSHPFIRFRTQSCHLEQLLFESNWLSRITPLEAAKRLFTNMTHDEQCDTSSLARKKTQDSEVYSDEEDTGYSLTVKALHLEGT